MVNLAHLRSTVTCSRLNTFGRCVKWGTAKVGTWEKRGQPKSLSEIDFSERTINNLRIIVCL
jgi:hypothetical protein